MYDNGIEDIYIIHVLGNQKAWICIELAMIDIYTHGVHKVDPFLVAQVRQVLWREKQPARWQSISK